MKLIKLNAIDSTNEYIKKIKTFVPDKLFCVYTYNQKQGKGQRANIWHSEPNKNLCISLISNGGISPLQAVHFLSDSSLIIGAGKGIRTLDLLVGNETLYH